MLENLIDSFKDQLSSKISEAGVSNDKVDDIVKLSGSSMSEELMSKVSSGGMDSILSLFTDESATSSSNSIVQGIIGNLTGKLSSSLGMDSSQANGLASKIVPFIVDMLGDKFRKSDSSNDAAELAEFAGMDAGNLIEKAKGLLGGKLVGLFGK